VGKADSLRLMSDGFAVDDGDLELFDNGLVNGVTLDGMLAWNCGQKAWETYEILDCASICSQNDRSSVIRSSTLRLCVYSAQVELFPHLLHEFVDVPAVLGTDGTGIGDTV